MMKLKIFKTIDEFFKNSANLDSEYKIKFLFHKDDFTNLDKNIIDKIYSIVPKENIFFNNSYEFLKNVLICNNYNNNQEHRMLRCLTQYSMSKFLRDNFGVNTFTLNKDRNNFTIYNKLFYNIEKYLKCINRNENFIEIWTNVSPQNKSTNTYSINNIEFLKQMDLSRELNSFISCSNYSVSKKNDFEFLKASDYICNNITYDINPIFLLKKDEYIERMYKNKIENFLNRDIEYYVTDDYKNVDNKKKSQLEQIVPSYKKISFKYNNKITFEIFIYLINHCHKIYTNNIDLLCLSIVFNKPVEYYGKEFDDYKDIIETLNINYDSEGNILNYDEVLRNIDIQRRLSYEHLKNILYRDNCIVNNEVEFQDEDYITAFKKEYFDLCNTGLIFQNTKNKNRDVIKNMSLIQCFFGQDQNQINATKKAFEIYYKTQKYIPEEHIFIEQQKSESDLKFKWVQSYGVKYITIIINNDYIDYIFTKLYLCQYGIEKSTYENIVCLDSDCFFVNDDAFLKINEKFKDNDFLIPWMWSYRSNNNNNNNNNSKLSCCELMHKDIPGIKTYPGFSFALKKKTYEKIPFSSKLILSTSTYEDVALIKLFTNVNFKHSNYYRIFGVNNNLTREICNFSYVKNILCHVFHKDSSLNNYHIRLKHSLNFNLKFKMDDKLNLVIKKDNDFIIYKDILKNLYGKLDKFKSNKNLSNLNYETFYSSYIIHIFELYSKIRQQAIIKYYGKIENKDDLKLYIVNTEKDINYLNYLKLLWDKFLLTKHTTIIYNSNYYISQLSILDIFNIEKESNVLIVDEYCLPTKELEVSNISKGNIAKFCNNSHIIFYRGDYSYITKSYIEKSQDFRDFIFKFNNVNNFLEMELYKNNIEYENIEKYFYITDPNIENPTCPDIKLINKDLYFKDPKYCINNDINYNQDINYDNC